VGSREISKEHRAWAVSTAMEDLVFDITLHSANETQKTPPLIIPSAAPRSYILLVEDCSISEWLYCKVSLLAHLHITPGSGKGHGALHQTYAPTFQRSEI